MKNFRTPLVFTLLTFLFFACSKDDEIETGLDTNLDANLILSIVNGHRQEGATCGSDEITSVSNLQWSDELAKAALDHSNDMQVNGYFSHTSQDGTEFSQRALNAGFGGSPVGENIASGYQDEASVMAGWMESTGHCRNIMNGNATHIGVARSSEGALWTMVLGRN